MPRAFDLASALLRCPSVTPHEGGALGVIEAALGRAGFTVHRLTFSEPGTPDVDNLYARLGVEPPCLMFAGHTDVVPPGDEALWTAPPFGGEVRDGELIGRGAVDMKGAIACFIAAALAHIEAHGPPRGSIALLVTGDEEGPAVNGTAKCLAWMAEQGLRFDHCLLGEPTNPEALGDMIKIGRRGSLTGRLTVHGRQGHVAYPHLADNPVRGLMRLLAALQDGPLDEPTSHFAASNLEVTSVDVGNPASNVIPAEARAVFNTRFNDRWSAGTLAGEIERRCAAAAEGVRYTLSFEPSNAEAFVTSQNGFVDLVSRAVEAETGRWPALSTGGGTSDARFIKAHGPVVEFGLVGRSMHGVDERVPLGDLEALTRIYGRVLAAIFPA